MLSEHVHELQTRPYAIHFNFLNGEKNKLRAMQERRFWFADEYKEREGGRGEGEGKGEGSGRGGCLGRNFYLEAETEVWA